MILLLLPPCPIPQSQRENSFLPVIETPTFSLPNPTAHVHQLAVQEAGAILDILSLYTTFNSAFGILSPNVKQSTPRKEKNLICSAYGHLWCQHSDVANDKLPALSQLAHKTLRSECKPPPAHQ